MIPGDDIVRNPLVLQSMGFSGRCVVRVGITSNMRQNEVRQNRKRSIREKGRWSLLVACMEMWPKCWVVQICPARSNFPPERPCLANQTSQILFFTNANRSVRRVHVHT